MNQRSHSQIIDKQKVNNPPDGCQSVIVQKYKIEGRGLVNSSERIKKAGRRFPSGSSYSKESRIKQDQ